MAVFYSEQPLNLTKTLQSHILRLMLFDGYRDIKCTNMVIFDTSERDITCFANAKALEERWLGSIQICTVFSGYFT